MPRFLRAINAGAEYPWPAAGITKEKVAAVSVKRSIMSA